MLFCFSKISKRVALHEFSLRLIMNLVLIAFSQSFDCGTFNKLAQVCWKLLFLALILLGPISPPSNLEAIWLNLVWLQFQIFNLSCWSISVLFLSVSFFLIYHHVKVLKVSLLKLYLMWMKYQKIKSILYQ